MDAFDITIIGAGSAGCALAARLVRRTDLRIALVEAGPDYGPYAGGTWPTDLVDAHHTPDSHDWGFAQSRARVVGGCSAHNECGLVRALPGDYDRWATPGWSDAGLKPVVEDLARTLPTHVCRDDDLAAWQRAFLHAAVAAGYPRFSNSDAALGTSGVGPMAQNIKDGVRWNAAFAFLDTVRPRVTILPRLLADRFVLEDDRARVLVAHGPDGIREIHAERFVLSAGVYGSPAILLRSGVGPATHLKRLGVRVHTALRGVGANLHDHPGIGFDYETTSEARRATKADAGAGRFYQAQVMLRVAPDLHVFPYQARERARRWSFGIFVYYLDPSSRGRMSLPSRDPNAPPIIDLALLRESRDVRALVKGVEVVHDLTERAPLADLIARRPRRFRSVARTVRFVRRNVTDYAHPVGTCRMGTTPAAGDVVDVRGRVHGLANVFVADASVIPRIPRANTNFTCFVIGARAADFVV